MSKAVLISIRPKWCEKIANGEKTIEVRRSRPNLTPPFKCYIYCTKPKFQHEDFIAVCGGPAFYAGGKVIAEFVCSEILKDDNGYYADVFYEEGLVPLQDQVKYAGNKSLYGWRISDLVVYEKPIPLIGPPQSWCYIEEPYERISERNRETHERNKNLESF